MSLPERVTAVVVYGVTLLAGLGSAGSAADPLVAAAVLAVVAAVGAALGLLLTRAVGPQRVRTLAAAFGERIRRRSLPRVWDPDASGRPRPRAPSPYPSAA